MSSSQMPRGTDGVPLLAVVVVAYRPGTDFRDALARLSDHDVFVVGIVNEGALTGVEEDDALLLDTAVANRGFAGGANVGITHALSRGADVVALLNDDVEIDLAALRLLAAEATPTNAVAPRLTADRPEDAFSGGAIQWQHGFGVHVPGERDFLTGAALVVHRATWERVGLLDESLFLYYEDVDWCLRAREAGVSLSVSEASAHHRGGASSGGTAGTTWAYYFTRNRIRILRRYRGRVAATRAWLWTLAWTIGYLRDARRRLIPAQLRALGDVARGRSGRGPYPRA